MSEAAKNLNIVYVDSRLKKIIPFFMEETQQDFDKLGLAIENGDYLVIEQISHNLKGECGGYGFSSISILAGEMETAATESQLNTIERLYKEMIEFFSHVEIRYKEEV